MQTIVFISTNVRERAPNPAIKNMNCFVFITVLRLVLIL
jgi:hypothetical protein